MPTTRVTQLTTDDEWDAAIPILRQLWNSKTPAEIRAWREEDGYRLFGLFCEEQADDRPIAVAGVSIQRVLHHARHAWIHDFVVDSDARRAGYGEQLLAAVESWAREQDCAYVALALRDGNDAAGSFYRQQDMDMWGAVIEKQLH